MDTAVGATTLILIRHGETEWNRVQRIQGHLDIPLSALGQTQAVRLAGRFGGAAGLRAAAVYSSDLQRAWQTALPLATTLGLEPVATPALRERAYGVFEGHDTAQIEARWPAEFARWQSRDPDFAPAGGESQQQFHDRTIAALEQVVRSHPGQGVVCVVHGGVLDCAYRHATQMPLGVPRRHPLLNAGINVLEYTAAGAARVVRWGDIAHLADGARDDTLAPAAASAPPDAVDPRLV